MDQFLRYSNDGVEIDVFLLLKSYLDLAEELKTERLYSDYLENQLTEIEKNLRNAEEVINNL